MLGAIIGFGTIATGHLLGYRQVESLSVVAVVDPVAARRQAAHTLDPQLRVYSTIAELFQHEHIDFVDICTPPYVHEYYIHTALTHGCHVLCEKPMLLAPAGYQRLAATAEAASRIIYPSHNYKFSPVMRVLTETIRSGELGDLLLGHFRTLRRGHARGVVEWQPDWRRDVAWAGGGILFDHGSHSVYLARHIAGLEPVAVSCILGCLKQDSYAATEDTAMLTIDFDGPKWSIDLSWSAGFRHTSYAIVGTRGSIVVENDMLRRTRAGAIDTQTIVSHFDDPLHSAWFGMMLTDFLAAVQAASASSALWIEPFVTSLVISKAYESASQGGVWVEIPQLPQVL